MVPKDYELAPLVAVEGMHFLIPSLCPDCGGRIYSFASQEDLDKMRKYYVELGRSSAAFFSWVFAQDNILVQINGDLPEERAIQYEAVLNDLRGALTAPAPAQTRGATLTATAVPTLTTYLIGDTASSGGWMITLNAADVIGDQLIANFTVANVGSETELISGIVHLSARGPDGTQLDATFCPSSELSGSVGAGDKLKGNVCFQSPAEAVGTRIYFAPEFVQDSQIIFELR